MAFCTDPSVTFLNKFGYNVVRLPRTGIEPMDVLGKNGSIERLGRLSALWKTTAAEPPVHQGKAANVAGEKTDQMEISIGLKILENVLRGFGVGAGLEFAYRQARKMQFTFTDVTTVGVDPLEAGQYLSSGDIDVANPVAEYFTDDEKQAFLIVDTLKSNAISVTATAGNGAEVSVDIPAIQQVLGAKVGVKVSGGANSTLTYTGQDWLTFGFKVFSIGFANGRWRLAGVKASGSTAFSFAAVDEEESEPVLLHPFGLVRLSARL